MLKKKKTEAKTVLTVKLTENENIIIEGQVQQRILCEVIIALLQYVKSESWEVFLSVYKTGEQMLKSLFTKGDKDVSK